MFQCYLAETFDASKPTTAPKSRNNKVLRKCRFGFVDPIEMELTFIFPVFRLIPDQLVSDEDMRKQYGYHSRMPNTF